MGRQKGYYPKRKTRAQIFRALFNYWSVKLLDKTFPIVKDNRFNGHCITDYDYETKKVIIRYNSRKLGKWSFALLVAGVFHEIGHVLQGSLPYETETQQITLEYDAEHYALKMIKKYYAKKVYNEVVSFMKSKIYNRNWMTKYPIHYHAFSQIKDYVVNS